MVVSNENYFCMIFFRFRNAVKCIKFWREAIAIFFFGSMGVWLPYFFNWTGYSNLFDPKTVFTFGVATMVMILEARIFMTEEEDSKSSGITKLFVFVGTTLALLAYFKSISISAISPLNAICWVQGGLALTALVWLFNVINRAEYDPSMMNSALGGDV
jgi:drug/metabolite transporter (DMT)-like permease